MSAVWPGQPITSLALLDRRLPPTAGAQTMEGDLGHAATRERIAGFAPDVVFHLAAVPGGAAEADYGLGRRVNLQATLALSRRWRSCASAWSWCAPAPSPSTAPTFPTP
jgi:nucleoside-diphosphate-sugar epimerase